MIRRQTMLVITFPTTTEAMAMEQICKTTGAPGRLIPVPREISAGCGMAWCAKPETEDTLRKLMEHSGIHPEAIQLCMV